MASTPLDIEHPFDQDGDGIEQTFRSPTCPDDERDAHATRPMPWCRPRPEEPEMAMIRVEPVEVHVRTGWFDGTPREITWGDERLPVTHVAAVREEAAAYPVITGPRTLFEVETSRARLALTYLHRSRRWTITALDEDRRAA
jgi:hypothetical protein